MLCVTSSFTRHTDFSTLNVWSSRPQGSGAPPSAPGSRREPDFSTVLPSLHSTRASPHSTHSSPKSMEGILFGTLLPVSGRSWESTNESACFYFCSCCCSVTQLCPTLCDPMDWSTREGNGNPCQYSCLENPVDRGAWWAAVYGVTQSWTRLKQLSLYAWTAAHQASLSITNSRSLLKLMSIASVMPSNHLILYHPLLLLPSIFPSIRVFSNESVLRIRWPKYWSFRFSASLSNEYSGLISFRIDFLISLQSKGLSRVFFSATVQRHQFFRAQPSLWSNSHIHTWLLEKP